MKQSGCWILDSSCCLDFSGFNWKLKSNIRKFMKHTANRPERVETVWSLSGNSSRQIQLCQRALEALSCAKERSCGFLMRKKVAQTNPFGIILTQISWEIWVKQFDMAINDSRPHRHIESSRCLAVTSYCDLIVHVG